MKEKIDTTNPPEYYTKRIASLTGANFKHTNVKPHFFNQNHSHAKRNLEKAFDLVANNGVLPANQQLLLLSKLRPSKT